MTIASVIICTLNQSEYLQRSIESVLSNHGVYELIIVNQGSKQSGEYLEKEINDERLKIVHSKKKSLCHARNIGIQAAAQNLILFTDDDCYVPENWVSTMSKTLAASDEIGMVFCSVVAGNYDASDGFVPTYICKETTTLQNNWHGLAERFMGAAMGLKKNNIDLTGYFDESILVGDDIDMAMRTLHFKKKVSLTAETEVIHFGFRTWEQGKLLGKRNWHSLGMVLAKFIRKQPLQYLPVFLYEILHVSLWLPFERLWKNKQIGGVANIINFVSGFTHGLRTELDRDHILFAKKETL